MILHVIRRELAARWIILPAAIAVAALAMLAIHSINHVRGDADNIMNGTWVGTLVVSTIVGMSLLGEELSNSRLSFYFARPFAPHAIFAGKLAAGVLLALVMQIAIVTLVALALPALSWKGSAFAERSVLAVGAERALATVGATLLGMAASIALGSKTRWFVVDALGAAVVGVVGTWFALRLEPDPAWLPADSIRSTGETAVFHAAAFAIGVIGLGVATSRALVHGRTDRRYAHRTLSMTLWPVVVPGLVLVAVIAQLTPPAIPDAPILPPGTLAVPTVASPEVVADEAEGYVPYLILVGEDNTIRIGAAASWSKLAAGRAKLARSRPLAWRTDGGEVISFRFPDDNLLAKFLMSRPERRSGDIAVASIALLDAALERRPVRDPLPTRPQDEEVREWDGHSFVEHQRSERWRDRGILGLAVPLASPGYPQRQAFTHGLFRRSERAPDGPLVLIAPRSKPHVLFAQLAPLPTAPPTSIAVALDGKVRRLRYELGEASRQRRSSRWIEVRISRSQVVVEAVPSTPIVLPDTSGLAEAIAQQRRVIRADTDSIVDVLLDDDVDAQRLVDVLAALDLAGVRAIAIGATPHLRELALRGHPIPTVSLRSANASIEHSHWWGVLPSEPGFSDCYSAALASAPKLVGLVTIKAFVEPGGRVASVNARGVDPALDGCIARAFSASPLSSRPGQVEFQLTLAQ